MSRLLMVLILGVIPFIGMPGISFKADEIAASQVRFVTDPTLSPDGQHIIFGFENDLWKTGAEGGTAFRLTAMEGKEFLPRVSPDGRWIAFSGSLDGNVNVYVMPFDGGEIRQLTFHQSADRVCSWSWDSREIYFQSSRYNLTTVYSVALEGGTPNRIFGHYFNIPHDLVVHPEDGTMFFTESWESLTFSHRKRYRGANRPDILSYNQATGVFMNLTDYEGKDLWPTIDASGVLYYASDEHNEEYNLVRHDQGRKTFLTHFDTSIGRPQVSSDGRKVVFTKDYRLAVYDTATGDVSFPDIRLASKNTLSLAQSFDVKGNITWFDVSSDKKKLAFVSRGRLFVSDIDGKFVREMPTDPAERVMEVAWGPDQKTLFYIRTRGGWANLYTMAADGSGEEIQLEQTDANSRLLICNHDKTSGVYLSGRNHVKRLDISGKKTSLVTTDELWGFQNSAPRFSPDGNYVLFTAYRNFEQDIMIHDLKNDTSFALTSTGVSERVPYWSPCGRYVYFASDRTQPNYPRGNTEDRIYRIPLYRFQEPFRSEKFENLFLEQQEKDTLPPEIRIDLEGIDERWEPIRVSGIGRQWAPQAFRQKGEDLLFFASNHDKGEWALWKLEQNPFEDNRPVKIEGPSGGMNPVIVQVKDDFYTLAGGNIYKINLGGNKLEAVEISYPFSRLLADEFSQIFYETWAAIEENFYADDFHGVDWLTIRERYSSCLPDIRTRENLRQLTNDMLGELNSSHMGFSSSGEEEKPFFSAVTAETGLVFDDEHPYQVSRVIAHSKLDLSEYPVQPGDVLVSVNGRRVEEGTNRNRFFYFPELPGELQLGFLRDDQEYLVRLKPHTASQISDLLYDEWIASNRQYVTEKTAGRVAYVFMKDMSAGSLNRFLIDMTTHGMDKEGLIIDIRFNRGGNVHDDVLRFLSQRPYLTWKYRGGAHAPQPNFSPSGNPMVMLINERSLSDAEMTAEGFKRLGLGPVIGTETYRWIIFTSGKQMVDGSFCRLPAWGCYTLDGQNLESSGVAPDIEVHNNFKHRLDGIDPQLDAAIGVLLNDMEEK